MWLYPGPSCPEYPLFKELSATEINTRIPKVLDLGANPNPKAGLAPLQEGVASTRVSMFGPVLVAYMILSFHRTHGLAQGPVGTCSEPRGANMAEDAVRRETNHDFNEKMRAWKERRRVLSTACQAMKERAEVTPTESRSLDEEEGEGEISPPPLSSLCITPPCSVALLAGKWGLWSVSVG
jgi:hypothetical protein